MLGARQLCALQGRSYTQLARARKSRYKPPLCMLRYKPFLCVCSPRSARTPAGSDSMGGVGGTAAHPAKGTHAHSGSTANATAAPASLEAATIGPRRDPHTLAALVQVRQRVDEAT